MYILILFISVQFFFISCKWSYYFLLFWECFTPALADGFSQEFKWQQVAMTLLNILANFNNAVIWIISVLLLFSLPVHLRFFSGFSHMHQQPFVSPSYSCFILFLGFLGSLGNYLFFQILLFSLYGVPEQQNPLCGRSSFMLLLFLLNIARSGHLAEIMWGFFYLKISENFVRLILQDGFRFVLVVHVPTVEFRFLHNFKGVTFPT